MIAPEYFNNHIAVEGEIIVKGVPNDTGHVLVWNPVTRKISRRTHSEIVSDLSVMTTNTPQDVGGRKIFYVSGNSNPEDTTLWTYGTGGAKAGIVFYSSGMDAGKINFDGHFHFKNSNDTGYKKIVSAGHYLADNGSISKLQNNTRVFHNVYQGYEDYVSFKGVLAIKFPQVNTAQTMFMVDINLYGYNQSYLGKVQVSFYKYFNTIITTGSRAVLNVSDNFPTDIVRVGIDGAGMVSICLGDNNTFWDSYIGIEVERVQTQYGVYNEEWSSGWTHALEDGLFAGYPVLNNIVVDRIATRDWLDHGFWKKEDVGIYWAMKSDRDIGILTPGNGAQRILTGGLLVSYSYDHSGLIPANGAYIHGVVKTGSHFEGVGLYSPVLNGSQVFNTSNSQIYFGNPSVSQVYFESGNDDLFHNRSGMGVARIWDQHNFNPNNYIPTSHPVYGVNSGEINEWRRFGGYWDNRNIQPAHLGTQRLQMGFTNWYNNGDQASHYADYLHFGGYQDSSGGSQNLIMFSKYGPGIRQFQGSPQGVSPYKSYVDYWHTGNFTQSEINNWNNLVANSSDFVTLHTDQTIIAKKTFAGGDGNGYLGAPLMINGNGNANTVYPTLSFHQPGLYAATVSYRGNGFYFMDINGTSFDYIRAAGYIKDGSDNNYVLLGGGGHKAVSDFMTSANLNDYLPNAGGTMTGAINFANNVGGIIGQVGDNDYWRVYGNTAGSNQGYLEMATGDDGNEPIYVRQYSGVFANLVRTATLLDEGGNTNFPGTVYSRGFIKASSDDSMILLGGGGHKAVSDFVQPSQLADYLTSNTTQTIDATKTIGFQNTLYSGWDRSSVVNPQMGPFSLLNLALQGAYPLYGDEEFRYGTNGIYVYNNYGNGTVTMTREAASDLPNRSGVQLRFNYNGNGATPGLGGFILGFNARPNAVFIQKFMAKLPVGYSFNNAENYMGDNSSVHWLTSRAGTGKWETYVRAVMCGTGTSFGNGGHVYVDGPDTAMEFYLAFAEIYEINSSVFSRIKETFYAKNETIDFNENVNPLITAGAGSWEQRIVLKRGWNDSYGDFVQLKVPGSGNNPASLIIDQSGGIRSNYGYFFSNNLLGEQIFNPKIDTLYVGNQSLPNIELQTTTNVHFNYEGAGNLYTFNIKGAYLNRDINFNQDNSGVNFYEGGKIYKKAGGGVHINRGTNGLEPRIETADGSKSWMIFHEGNHTPFKNLRSGVLLEDVSESGIYRQEGPSSGFSYTTTLNLNSSDGRQQLTIERGGGGMKFRGSYYGSGNQGWSDWKDVVHSDNISSYLNSYGLVNQSGLNSQLSGYATLNGVQTFTNTNTFAQSPVIPNGTLGTHAVNLNQLNGKSNALENATGIGFSSGNYPSADGSQYPYIYFNNGGTQAYIPLATQEYTQTNFLSTPNGTSVMIPGSDLNGYFKTGFYRGSGLANAPMNNSGWWFVAVETHDYSWIKQTATSYGSGNTPNITYQRTMMGGRWTAWVQIWTTGDFSISNIQQWNYAYQYGLKLNEEFTVNQNTGLVIADDYFGGESGIIDHQTTRLLAAKRGPYYFYGSENGNFDGLNFECKNSTFGMGMQPDSKNKLIVNGSVKAFRNFRSEEERPDTLFIPNGETADLRDEIINDESDYAIRLDPHEYEIESEYLEVRDRNRLIHVIGQRSKMIVDFTEIFPKQHIVIYNFDEYGGTLEVRIQGNTIYHVESRCFLKLYVTRSLRVIAERQQPCDMIW